MVENVNFRGISPRTCNRERWEVKISFIVPEILIFYYATTSENHVYFIQTILFLWNTNVWNVYEQIT